MGNKKIKHLKGRKSKNKKLKKDFFSHFLVFYLY